MRFLILGRSVGLKKKSWYPRMTLKVNIYICGLTKCTMYCKKCSCFCSCFSLRCDYAHIFIFKMPKIWVGRTTLEGEKKRIALLPCIPHRLDFRRLPGPVFDSAGSFSRTAARNRAYIPHRSRVF